MVTMKKKAVKKAVKLKPKGRVISNEKPSIKLYANRGRGQNGESQN